MPFCGEPEAQQSIVTVLLTASCVLELVLKFVDIDLRKFEAGLVLLRGSAGVRTGTPEAA